MVLLSREGVRQGDVFGSALFALSMVKHFAPGQIGLANGRAGISRPEVVRVAIMDDFYLVGPPEDVLTDFDHFQNVLADEDVKLIINAQKSQVLLPQKYSQDLVSQVKERGFSICSEGMPALGAMVGRDSGFSRRWLLDKLQNTHGTLFQALRHVDMPVQHCFQFLRQPRNSSWSSKGNYQIS